MIYLDYAKKVANGYILNFFADTEEDIAEVSNGKHFITKNGTDYGIPQPSSTVVITMPDKTKKTYILNEAGEWQLGGGETDYSRLTNVPITLANLADKDFIPEANTYYEHLGETTENFVKGIIYLYDGTEYKAIDGSGSDAGVQPDYNQNDSTAPDYIKNRPFYDASVALFDETITTNTPEGVNLYVWETTSKTVDVNIGDEVKVIFNGVEYTQTAKDFEGGGYVIYVGNASFLNAGEDTKEPFFITLNLAFLSSEMQEKPITGMMVVTKTAYNGEVKIITNGVKTIDPKFIKDMYYETTNTEILLEQTFSTESMSDANIWATEDSVIKFAEGDTVKVEFGGVEYTQKVEYLFGVLYIGNLSLIGMEPNTGEPFVIANIYFPAGLSKVVAGTSIATSQPQTNATIKVYKSEDILKTIDPKYIKDMYYTKSESDVQKTLVFKGEINGFTENIPNIFEEGDMVSLKEPEVQLDVSVIAKYHSDESSSFAYIGNLALLDDLTGGTFPDTKEDYILVCGYDDENKTSMLMYGNKNCRPPHNIEVYKGGDPIVRIPEKYMPENVALKSYVDTAISNAITKTLNTEV